MLLLHRILDHVHGQHELHRISLECLQDIDHRFILVEQINHSPRIGQNTEEIKAHAKLRLGCVSSSLSAIRYRSRTYVSTCKSNRHWTNQSTCDFMIGLSGVGKFCRRCTSMTSLCGCKCSRTKHSNKEKRENNTTTDR